ncbi:MULTISPECIES: hypothetical protein [Bacillus cereus group]|uniref:Uncharacterized protein n=1 Tax=Bacillus mycoides TaxID=1405 RepID=A0A1E8BLZ2_BACMY|nr:MULTISPECIES: hypothetical protein [Bacillus cereus group]EJV71835.1 hypothetical protein IEM_00586 [Bacillus cereus BAG6O-2]OFD41907.1 hypothetical protein BWGOE2_28590 [Bacillus mycoides]OFD45769.1 hypothetical protein BWGOE1_29470 [Bacillus mycoides]OFD92297.1 hypothetical protein BWGOE11_30410 [Bacillus mycoides]OFD99915.1 hypothetical protein BWGOE13_30100 [Bacillus mycoides]
MKKLLYILSVFVLCVSIQHVVHSQSDAPSLSSDCLEERKVRDEKYVKNIMRDIRSTFNLNFDENSFWEVDKRDLEAAHFMYGGRVDDTYYNSLTKVFESGGYRGEPRLFVKPLEAFLLYKEIEDTNVIKHLELEKGEWVVTETKKKQGKMVEYKPLQCEKDYLKKRNEYHNMK